MPHRAPCWSRVSGNRESTGAPFSKSTHPCKNDQSHEFANGESLADQQRQRQIMREMGDVRGGVKLGRAEVEEGVTRKGGCRSNKEKIFKGIDWERRKRLSECARRD